MKQAGTSTPVAHHNEAASICYHERHPDYASGVPVKVASFESRAVRVAREPGPSGPRDEAHFITLKLRTDDGVEGVAYAGYTSPLLTKGLKAVVDAVAEMAVGRDPHEADATAKRLLEEVGEGSPAGLVMRAVAAIDVALWDIRGKALGMPVWKLLGASSGVVPTYASGFLWRHYDLHALAATAVELVSQGFRAMKFRIGGEATTEAELVRLRTVREAVGDGVDVMVDVNQGWSVNKAVEVGREMVDYGLFWLEDPTHFQDYAGLAQIAEALETPIAAGEYHYGIEPFRHMLEARSVDIVMVDLMRVGGITQWMEVARMAEAHGLPVVTHLATEVLGHALAAAPNGLYVEHMPWTFSLFEEVPQMNAEGRLVMPEAPGLGLVFDEARLAANAL